MAWLALLFSSVLEAVWATSLSASDGFSKAVPTAVFIATLAVSMAALAYVAKRIPVTVAYAVWSGLGAAFTVTWAMITGAETAGVVKMLFLLGIVGCVMGLKLLSKEDGRGGGTADGTVDHERAPSGSSEGADLPGACTTGTGVAGDQDAAPVVSKPRGADQKTRTTRPRRKASAGRVGGTTLPHQRQEEARDRIRRAPHALVM
ncbi:DMT family transporter [Streptomyces fuscichromogenes]|uniref:DMT family transporter n=1 Tax=Streptomyces fuscichromogenes TaxID=1324013 RepID=UPI0037F3F697